MASMNYIDTKTNWTKDKSTLYSYLLVNRLWCEISVRILWRNIWKVNQNIKVDSAILNTLVTCLPNESKELLYKNEIFIPISTSKSPLFNYPEFQFTKLVK
ncbi:hypothetical protein C1645_822743 [Glomus cerebriforme]|uniref:Uncharacterized protein n=1 Tax=Glomus cerebriforme TaxID=658196 RepID=A0A397T443_9GLOM|nr:hypothetical protein C1645_822743 [Glomus cerebriforme]